MRQLLLDTNVVVWLLLNDRDAVSEDAVRALTDERNVVSLSAVSVWEIAIKRSVGKLRIDEQWASALMRLPFAPMPISALHAERVERLPWHHRDPFDRLLIAQASLEDHALVTADPRIAEYDIDVLW